MKSTPLVLLFLTALASGCASGRPPVSALSTSSADLPPQTGSAARETPPAGAALQLATASPFASGESSARELSALPPSSSESAPATSPEFPERQSIEALDWLAGVSAVDVERGSGRDVLTLASDPLFEPGAASLKESATFKLDVIVRALKLQAGREIIVRGHTDSLGDRGESKALSLRRAQALRDYFIAKGVAPEHLRAEGAGSDHPVADNSNPLDRAKNRRLELIIDRPSARSLRNGKSGG